MSSPSTDESTKSIKTLRKRQIIFLGLLFLLISALITFYFGHILFYYPGGGFFFGTLMMIESIISVLGIIIIIIDGFKFYAMLGALLISIESTFLLIGLFWDFIETLGFIRDPLAILSLGLLLYSKRFGVRNST